MSVITDWLKNTVLPAADRASAGISNALINAGIQNKPTQDVQTLSKGSFTREAPNFQKEATATAAATIAAQSIPKAINFVTENSSVAKGIINTAGYVYEQGIRRPFTTAEIVAPWAVGLPFKGQGFKNVDDIRNAWDSTKTNYEEGIKGVGLTQAFADITAEPFRPLVGQNESVAKYFPWLSPDFDLTDPKQRTAAFEDSWSGALFTGGLSLAQVFAESAIGASVAKTVRLSTGLEQSALLNLSHQDMKLNLVNQMDDSVKWVDEGMVTKAPNGLAPILRDYVTETNPIKIQESPFIQNLPPEIQFRASYLIAESSDAETISLIMRSHWGDGAAFNKLWDKKASAADSINEHDLFDFDPNPLGVEDRMFQHGPMAVFKDQKKAQRINAVIEDIAKSNEELAAVTQSWAIDLGGSGVGTTNWAPTRFASIEEARNAFAQMRYDRRYGKEQKVDLDNTKNQDRAFNIVGKTIQSNTFMRPIHVVQNLFNEKPRGLIDYSDPRGASDAAIEILAEMNRIKEFRNPQYAGFKGELTTLYAKAANDTQRNAALQMIEQKIAIEIGTKNNVSEALTLEILDNLRRKRDEVKSHVTINGHIPLEDGSIMLPDPMLRSQMASNYTLLDFKLFDRALQDYKTLGLSNTKQGKRFFKDNTTAIADHVNSIFSHAVLIRPGYIPKNSIVEPAMRVLAVGDAIRMTEDVLPSTKRFIENNVNRGLVTKDVVLDSLKGKTSKRFRNKVATFDSDITHNADKLKLVEIKIKNINNEIKDLDVKKMTGKPFDERVVNSLNAQKQDLTDELNLRKNTILNLKKSIDETLLEWQKQIDYRAKLKVKKTAVSTNAEFTLASGEKISVPQGRSIYAKGGQAAASEIDPTVANWLAAGQSFATSRINSMRQQIQQAPIRPGDADYWTSYAKDVNIHAKNDELVKMWASGISKQEASTWLNGMTDVKLATETIGREAGKNYRDQLIEKNPNFQLLEFEKQIVNETWTKYDILVPDADLRQQALIRDIGATELEARYSNNPNLPVIDGNKSLYPLGIVDRTATWYNNLAKIGYQGITAPERILFKNPFFDKAWNESIRRQIYQAEQLGVEVTSQLVNDRYRFIANAEATKKVESVFYSVRRNNNLNYGLRFLAGFPTAILNSYKFWGKNILKNPYNAVLQYKFQGIPYDLQNLPVYEFGGVVDQDGNPVTRNQPQKDGEERFLLLGIPPWADPKNLTPFVKKINLKQWDFLLGNISSSFIVQVSLSTLVSSQPNWAKALKDILGTGIYNQLLYNGRPVQGDSLSSMIGNVFTPGYVDKLAIVAKQGLSELPDIPFISSILNVSKDEPAFAERMNLLYNVAMTNWVANGSPKGQQPKQSDIKWQTYKSLLNDAFEKWAYPIAPTNQPVSQFFKDQRQIAVDKYKNGSKPLPQNKTPFQAATDDMASIFGSDVNRFLGSSSSKATSMEQSLEAYNNLKNNKDLAEKIVAIDPQLLDIMVNPDTPGLYDPAVSSWMQHSKVGDVSLAGGKKSFSEMQDEFERNTGFNEYAKLKDKYAVLTNGRRIDKFPKLQAQFNVEKEQLMGEYKAFGKQMQSGYVDRTNNALTVIAASITDPNFMTSKSDSRKWQTIYVWMNERENAFEALQNARSTYQKSSIKEQWANKQQDLINTDTSFAEFHSKYLDNDKLQYGISHYLNLLRNN